MTVCVSESSYYAIFITSIVISFVLIFSNAYSYTRFNNYKNDINTATASSLGGSGTMSLITLLLGVIGLVIVFVMFFGFTERLVGVSANVNVGSQ
jgi:heme/copper-type cytochrome/quinol oxidase subunit 2